MTFAQKHRKLGRDGSLAHDRAEDLLTSSVFQLLRYIPLDHGLIPVLNRAQMLSVDDGGTMDRTEASQPLLATRAEFDFWHRLECFGTPDLLIRLYTGNTLARVVCVEAKFYAGKSGTADDATDTFEDEEPTVVGFEDVQVDPDQLVKYWQGMTRTYPIVPCTIIYLTAHPLCPIENLRQSLDREPTMRLGWLSWHTIWQVANQVQDSLPAADLAILLECLGLYQFHGFDQENLHLEQRSGRFFSLDAWFESIPPAIPSYTSLWHN